VEFCRSQAVTPDAARVRNDVSRLDHLNRFAISPARSYGSPRSVHWNFMPRVKTNIHPVRRVAYGVAELVFAVYGNVTVLSSLISLTFRYGISRAIRTNRPCKLRSWFRPQRRQSESGIARAPEHRQIGRVKVGIGGLGRGPIDCKGGLRIDHRS